VETLIITNAAGGINTKFQVGDFVLINDHINTLPDNPLRGDNLEELGTRFPNLLDAYSGELRQLAQNASQTVGGGTLNEGVYLVAHGPMYETPAEIKAFAQWGADLVGMSTVPEVIAARHMGMKVLGISVVTNMAAGMDLETELSHEEVLETTERRRGDFAKLLFEILKSF
jgi:purine-nucleoside phosphorylase